VKPGGTGGTIGGGSGGAAGGATGTGGGAGGAGATCQARTSFTLAVRVVLDVTWPATTATGMGTGKVYLWNRAKLAANGTALSGDTWSCGTSLPEFSLNAAGQLVTGASKVSVEVPHAVWDAPSIPKFPNLGTISGWNPGNTITIEPTVALVGLSMTNTADPWPMSYTGVTAVDHDGDGKPGFTAVPRDMNPYTAPPTGLGLLGSAPTADRLYLASRTVVGLSGKLDSCTEQSGTANVTFFDSHVVGCRVKGTGADCTAAQTDFVDVSRTNYKVNSGTFMSKEVPEGASCADVRAALPM
jgi:prepilin-type processing-associated H-X9-DG protein